MQYLGVRQSVRSLVATYILVVLAAFLWVAAISSSSAQAGEGKNEKPSCCELFGLWVFAPSGDHGSFLPNHRFLWQNRIYVYDCSGPTITFDWERKAMLDVRHVSTNIIEYKAPSGKTYKAARKSNKVVVNGKIYRACPGGGASGSGQP